jgi:hypothetical protein
MTTADTMDRRRLGGSVVVVAAALLALSGCATMRRHEAAGTEQLLAAAGFQMRPANSPQQLQDLRTMPPLKLVSRSKDGNAMYTFADPDSCHCLYVGGPKEYSAYQRLLVEREIAAEKDEALVDWGRLGPWWW